MLAARFLSTALVVLLLSFGCGGPDAPPRRGVIESDIEGWSFRRYQSVLDVEVWVQDNKAVAHTASYALKSAEKEGELAEQDVVNVFVTRYEKDVGIVTALVRFVRRLAQESGYRLEETRIEGTRLFELEGAGEYWVMWAAPRHVVKLGGRGRKSVPGDLIEAYSERYPSRIRAGALEESLAEEPEDAEVEEEPFNPDNPRPEWK